MASPKTNPVPKTKAFVELDNAFAKPITQPGLKFTLVNGVATGYPTLVQKVYVVDRGILADITERKGEPKDFPATKLAIVDCRLPSEAAGKQIKGAKHLPLPELNTDAAVVKAIGDQFANDKSLMWTIMKDSKVSHIVVYCAFGAVRSVRVVQELANLFGGKPELKGKKMCIVPGGMTEYVKDAAKPPNGPNYGVTAWA